MADDLIFEWDPWKNVANRRKHGVSFEEAVNVFRDREAMAYFDEAHSESEDRFAIVGVSRRLRTLVVSYCHREKGAVIRILSARKATRKEQAEYVERLTPL
ncbi:MAG: BrnT family toxin [Planctomycetes bacterium]|nr:BrnT family toxin [Planctomycetota bacterium]